MTKEINNHNKLVSIILPVYNGEKHLAESIGSCLAQTYRKIELIIINDASTDKTLEIAEKFAQQDDRVTVYSNKTNQKLPASLNTGHKMARGNLLTWTSHDNSYNLKAIQKMVTTIETTGTDIVYTDYNIIEDDGKFRRKVVHTENSHLLLENTVGACFLYKQEVFKRNGGYNENLHTVEDYDFWLRSLVHSKFQHISEDLYNYRSHENSLSSRIDEEETHENKNFRTVLKFSYLSFFQQFLLSKKDYAELFTSLHRHEKISVYNFLKKYEDFKRDISILDKKLYSFNPPSLFKNVDLKLRSSMHRQEENQNLKTLLQILLKRPTLLTGYDRRRSLQLIFKCLKK
ncbi:glycosyltransferase [Salinimicrobium sp. CDJ15-91]|uniref:Glycosyltransferase n=1 Tax=Salinimicrobium oceani TaxID=2722702 RepID=A0ABX1D3Y2_9FLAO|nr:glycosyltransferase [Salinimicrobium oceani]